MKEQLPSAEEMAQAENTMTPEQRQMTVDREAEVNSQRVAVEYDAIALGYQEATQRELRKLTLEPTLMKYLQEVKGKTVLDLACGEGYSSRLCESLGATRVVGVDVSEKEIAMARQQEQKEREVAQKSGRSREDIEYVVGDAAGDLSQLEKFDMVTAVMLLHYSSSREILDKMIKNIRQHLKSGGVFITSTGNPDLVTGYENYGVRFESATKKEGDPFIAILSDFEGKEYCRFTNYY